MQNSQAGGTESSTKKKPFLQQKRARRVLVSKKSGIYVSGEAGPQKGRGKKKGKNIVTDI